MVTESFLLPVSDGSVPELDPRMLVGVGRQAECFVDLLLDINLDRTVHLHLAVMFDWPRNITEVRLARIM